MNASPFKGLVPFDRAVSADNGFGVMSSVWAFCAGDSEFDSAGGSGDVGG